MVSVKRLIPLLMVVALSVVLLGGQAEGSYQYKLVKDKTVLGVRLRGHLSLNVDHGNLLYYGWGKTEASRSMEGLYVRNKGWESCNYTFYTAWDTPSWRYGTSFAAVGGTGSYHPWYQCGGDYELFTDGWYKWRNWTWSPGPIIEDAQGVACCRLFDLAP